MRALILIGVTAALAACGAGGEDYSQCDRSVGLRVHVKDFFSKDDICDAVVSVTDDSFDEQLTVEKTGSSCYYTLGPRPGSYEIEAAATGYRKSTEQVTVDGDDSGCAVETAEATVTLVPN